MTTPRKLPGNQEQVAVIGSGLGGLAAACTLAARGHKVILLDKNPWLGGKAAELKQAGFRFDMGPTILTLPSVLRAIFEEAGRELSDHLELVPLDPQWRSFFSDGSTLDLLTESQPMAQELQRFAPNNPKLGEQYTRFLDTAQRLREITDQYYFWKPIGSLWDMFRPADLLRPATLADVLAIKPGQSVGGVIRRHVKHPQVAQMLDHFTQYVGSCPDASPAVLCGIANMQTRDGIWYPIGGIRAMTQALIDLAQALGVEVRTEQQITKIEVDQGAVSAVHCRTMGSTNGSERVPVEGIVCNSDVVRSQAELLPADAADKSLAKRYEPACSGVVLYLGLRERYEHLLHHNFVFSEDPEQEFAAIYQQGQPAADPTVYLCAPAQTDPAVAPAGGEALYALVHTPFLRPGHNWQQLLPRYRRVILDKLASTAGLEDLEQRIVFKHALTPQDIHDRYQVLNGAIYGLASHGRFTGAFKPSNVCSRVRGLTFAGGSAHPGPGMPMVLMSGWIAADALSSQLAAKASA